MLSVDDNVSAILHERDWGSDPDHHTASDTCWGWAEEHSAWAGNPQCVPDMPTQWCGLCLSCTSESTQRGGKESPIVGHSNDPTVFLLNVETRCCYCPPASLLVVYSSHPLMIFPLKQCCMQVDKIPQSCIQSLVFIRLDFTCTSCPLTIQTCLLK